MLSFSPLPPFTLRVVPHTLHFKQPAGTSRGVYRKRQVWYVVLRSRSATQPFIGVGECAPLFDLSCDYDAHYAERLQAVCREVERTGWLDNERWRDQPSMLFGLQTAWLSAQASRSRGDARLLFPSAFTEGKYGIAINGLVWMGRYDEMEQRMEAKLAAGFRCVKLKIGAIDFESELALIKRLRARFSADTVQLRVDANGGFTPQEALGRLEQLAPYGIHSIEQPIRQGQWTEMARLCQMTPIPIALDEELIGVNAPAQKVELLDTIRPQFLVLKPSLHGGLTGAAEWIERARERHIDSWVTSALESNVGLNAIAQWCAARYPHATLPQGLGTGQLFTTNYEGAPLRIEGDCLWYGQPDDRAFAREVEAFIAKWQSDEPTLTIHTSGSTGTPKPIRVKKKQMTNSARMTIEALQLEAGQTALLAMPLRFIAGQMVVVRSLIAPLQLIAVAPTSHPYAHLQQAPFFAALTPMQVYASLQVPHERSLLRRTKRLLIGGGAISESLEAELATFPHPVWSSYGMSETLSHIALRRLNGPERSLYYKPLAGVTLSLSENHTLRIAAPKVCDDTLTTNDIVELLPDQSFRVSGRLDNVVCSGGIKLQLEEIEQQLHTLPLPFVLTAVPDEQLGEALTLLYLSDHDEADVLKQQCRERLTSPYEVPRHFLRVDALPLTPTGKPARAEARKLALQRSHART